MAKMWKKLGLTATLAAGFGVVGASAYNVALQQNSGFEAETSLEDAQAGSNNKAANEETENRGSDDVASDAATNANQTEEETDGTKVATNTDQVIDSTETGDESEALSVKEVAANSMPAMVAITNTSVQEVQNYYGGYGFGYGSNGQSQTVESVSAGTGVIIRETDEDVIIVTNAHVIADATELSVAFVDESAAEATVIGADSDHDIAVISVSKSDLSESTLEEIKVISIGNSEETEVGEEVVAIGNALGYGQSVSAGIISAKDRTITTQNSDTGAYVDNEGLFQTDAAINPGNSGGALLNMQGELIAINSAKYADESVEGMGYAIPVDVAMPIVESLMNGTSTTESSAATQASGTVGVTLGISGASVTSEYSGYYDVPEGVYVNSVESGSCASEAGIQEGDIITAINGTEIGSIDELKSELTKYSTGDTVSVTVSRSADLQSQFGQNRTVYESGTLEVTF